MIHHVEVRDLSTALRRARFRTSGEGPRFWNARTGATGVGVVRNGRAVAVAWSNGLLELDNSLAEDQDLRAEVTAELEQHGAPVYVAVEGADVFHGPSHALRSDAPRRFFATREAAIEAGLVPCQGCKP